MYYYEGTFIRKKKINIHLFFKNMAYLKLCYYYQKTKALYQVYNTQNLINHYSFSCKKP